MTLRNEKGQFVKGHKIFPQNPFTKGNKIGPRFKREHTPWNKGLKNWNPNSKEVGKKISRALKGKKLTKEHRQKLSKVKKGRPIPWFTKENRPRGENHYLWKGGSPVPNQVRSLAEYKKWREKVYTRDNFTCVLCGIRGGKLNVDHYPRLFSAIMEEFKIKSFQDALNCKALWAIENGRTLCIQCHKKVTWLK